MEIPRYGDGTPIQVGDRVLIEHRRTEGIVERIVVSPGDIAAFGTHEAGVMLLSEPFGRVYWPLDDDQDPLVFVARGALPDILPST